VGWGRTIFSPANSRLVEAEVESIVEEVWVLGSVSPALPGKDLKGVKSGIAVRLFRSRGLLGGF